MLIIDAHCDTMMKVLDRNDDLYKNNFHVDLERMTGKGNSHVQFFAAFVGQKYAPLLAMERAILIIERFYRQAEKYSNYVAPCRSYSEVEDALNAGKVAAILSVENGEALQGDMYALKMFHDAGVRSLCLTWNYSNEVSAGIANGDPTKGLTPYGKEIVQKMNSFGMIVDLSHIAEKGFWDVLAISKHPVIVSHSNARSICDHRRNLTDEQIIAMKKNNGVIGVNFFPCFLNECEKANIWDIINHIDYIAGLSSIDNVGIGTDFDGAEYMPDGINGIQDIEKIFNELLKLNYSQDSVEKIAGKNFMRIIKEVLG